MESNPLFAALQNIYGDGTPPPPDTSTVRGLLSHCKLWLSGEVSAAELHNPCLQMAGRLKGAAKETEKDLRSNPNLVKDVRGHIQRSAEAYQTLSEVLDRLPQLAQDNDTDGFKKMMLVFEEERQAVLDSTEAIERRHSGEHRLCPRCGDIQDQVCPKCRLTPLFPDPKGNEYDRTKTADLEPLYATVYQAYSDVMSGTKPLSVVLDAVNSLEDAMVEIQKGYEEALSTFEDNADSPQGRESIDVANRMLDEVERVFQGIDRMKGTYDTFRMSDLTRGWDTIFDAAVDIQRLTQRFLSIHQELSESDQPES